MCKLCGGVLEYLGRLGNLLHFRCQNCGMEASCEENDAMLYEYDDDEY